MSIPTTPPSGFRDFLPDACALRAQAVETISRVYRSYGFSQIATSGVEELSVLTGKGGGENEKLIFKILKRGEKLEQSLGSSELADLGLRFDLTLPLARFYSRHQSALPHPFKAFHIGPVWRAERAQKGRYREFYQCDVDIIGSDNIQCEIEVLSAAMSALLAMGVSGPTVVLNDRTVLFALLDAAQVPEDKRQAVCILLDKLDKVERGQILSELEMTVGSSSARLIEAGLMSAAVDVERLTSAAPEAMKKLLDILRHLQDLHGPDQFLLSPSLVRGFDYYTGPVFEFRHPKLAGSLGGGGRYDRLTEKFGGQSVPACGASIGFERLLLLLEESGEGPKTEGPDVCVTVFSEELRGQTLAIAARLRQAGLSVDVYPGAGKFKAQFKYADSRRARAALVLGPEEAAAGKIKTKNMRNAEERLETVEDLITRMKAG